MYTKYKLNQLDCMDTKNIPKIMTAFLSFGTFYLPAPHLMTKIINLIRLIKVEIPGTSLDSY